MQAAFAIPGDLSTPTGGYVYDRRVIEASAGALTQVRLADGFPDPSEDDLRNAATALSALNGPALIDGLAYGAFPTALIDALPHAPIALCHHPLGLEAGLSAERAAALIENERAALARAAHVVVTSAATKRTLLADFGLNDAAVTIAPPGLDRAPPANPAAGPPIILTVASITPRKAHDVLIDALAALRDLHWRAVWVGPDDRAPDWAERIRARVAASGVADRIEMRGGCGPEELEERYGEASIFCLPSRYEGYGMVFAEAMMRALPIVAAETEAAREVIPTAAGRIAATGDAASLASALRAMLEDPSAREDAGRAGRAHALTLPDWSATWSIVKEVLEAHR
ncbi:MAG: glycosyltransferase family 4 protein [Pseudomonadota bacterium]